MRNIFSILNELNNYTYKNPPYFTISSPLELNIGIVFS